MDNFDKFDNQFFNISPREASHMDPQQRLLLEEAWHCVEDSGVPLAQLRKKSTAVCVGAATSDYIQHSYLPGADTDAYTLTGNYHSTLGTRVSYALGFKGTSFALDAACASFLFAAEQARNVLLSMKSDYAMAAGVNINCHPLKFLCFSKGRFFSPGGQCKTFDKNADGYVSADGIGLQTIPS